MQLTRLEIPDGVEQRIQADIDHYNRKILPSVTKSIHEMDEIRLERALYRKSFRAFIPAAWKIFDSAEFIPGWHIDCIAEYMEALYRNEIRNLIINIPPRHMKSSIISVMFPAWVWINDARKSFMCCSYAESLSIRDSLKCRTLIQSGWFQKRWGALAPDDYENADEHTWKVILADDQNQKKRYQNTQKGVRLSTSVCGAVTGEGADFVAADDPHNILEAESDAIRNNTVTWWRESIPSRLNNPRTGHKLIIMQRTHDRDLSGEMLETGEYEHLVLPAYYEHDHPYVFIHDKRYEDGSLLWKERFNADDLKKLEKAMGEYAFAGQYQQRPSPREGGAFKTEWFKIIDEKDVPSKGVIIRGWDLACSVGKDADWTVGVTMKGVMLDKVMYFYILRVDRFMLHAGASEKQILLCMGRDGTFIEEENIPQDPAQAGKMQKRYLRIQAAGHPLVFSLETNKESRAIALAAQLEIGHVFLVKGSWNELFIKEFTGYPNGRWDDQVAATCRAFHRIVALLKKGDNRAVGASINMQPEFIRGHTFNPNIIAAYSTSLNTDFFDRNSLINPADDVSLTAERPNVRVDTPGRFLMPIEV